MTISIVQGPIEGAEGVTTATVTLNSCVAGNSLLILSLHTPAVAGTSFSSASCPGETVTSRAVGTSWDNNVEARWLTVDNIQSNGSKTVTVTYSDWNGSPRLVAFELAGGNTANLYDNSVSWTATGSATMSTSLAVTANAAIFAYGLSNTGSGALTPGAAYTGFNFTNFGNTNYGEFDLDAGAAGAKTVDFDFAWATADHHILAISLNAGGGGGGGGTLCQTVVLKDTNGVALANLQNLKCYGWDVNTPASVATTLPVDYTATGSTDGSGVLTFIRTNTTLSAGNVALLLITSVDGSAGQTPPGRSFFGPVALTVAP